MAINLNTLTSPATSGDVLAEALTTADFLEGVPVLRNLARGSQKGGDAKQDVALNQPKALPLIDGDGYLYVPDVVSNTCSTPDDSSIDITGDITIDIDLTLKNWNDGTERNLVSKYRTSDGQRSYRLYLTSANVLSFVISSSGAFESGGSRSASTSISFPDNQRAQIRVQWRSSGGRVQFFTSTDKGQTFTQLGTDQNTSGITSIYNGSADLDIAHRTNVNRIANSAIHSVQIYGSVTPSSSSLRFNCDFTATNVRHGDTKFKCATGQVVTINKSGNDPATIIKKPVLRFDGVDDFMDGVFGQTVTEGGYAFAAFSVLGDGGEPWGRVLSFNATGGQDYQNGGHTFIIKSDATNNVSLPTGTETEMFDDVNGDILIEAGRGANYRKSRINNASVKSQVTANTMSFDEFNLGSAWNGTSSSCIDLEYLAFFPATITDDQADSVRNYINNRNNVFSLIDSKGFYFFDPQKATFTGNFTDANTLDGYITGSDLGDTDVRSNLTLVQATQNDQPSTDGYTITFNDSAEHLEFENSASQNLSGWQVVGSSLGTFAYRVQGAVTELNLLGNFGSTSYRQAGQSYGMILLPESATGADIEAARKLLIDRGAADGTTPTSLYNFWRNRVDIVEFKHINTSSVTSYFRAWRGCSSLTSFPLLDHNNAADFREAWYGCSALTSFPSGAKLGTAANNVNFSSAWQDSGLTSFPALDLSSGTTFFRAWQSSDLISFPANIDLTGGTDFIDAWRNINTLLSFPAGLNLSSGENFDDAWRSCTSLTGFPLINISSGKFFRGSWYNCSSMTDWPSGFFDSWSPSSILSGVFQETWAACSALSAISVQNILTSLDASGQHGTDDGTSTGNPLGDSGIDIDYDGTTLSAATTAAIDSLSGKGWEVFINGELVIPNILDLAPAAAYSLRSFDADADPNVVNVRRSSDSALRDFKASEVSDGTLVAWVNTDVERYASDFSSSLDSFLIDASGTGIAGQTFDGESNVLKLTPAATTSSSHGIRRLSTIDFDSIVSLKALVYIPSSNTIINGVQIRNKANDLVGATGVTDGWIEIEATGAVGSSGGSNSTLSINATSGGSRNFTSNGTDVFYCKDVSVTITDADGHVTTWYDQGGTNHATQTSGSAQPKIVDGGALVTEGGLPAVDFDGVDDHLFKDSVAASFTGDDIPISIFACFKETASSYSDIVSLSNSTSIVPLKRLFRISGHSRYDQRDDASTFSFPIGNSGLTNQILNSVTSTGNSLNLYEQGVLKASDTTDFGNFTLDRFTIGVLRRTSNDAPMNGQIQEIVVFNTDQSANRTGIENNINDHFDIYS